MPHNLHITTVKPAKTVKDIVSGETFRAWRLAHERAEALQREIDAILAAAGIGPECCRVERLAEGELRLMTISAAAAVRIRQILPTLQQTLKNNGYAVQSACVQVVKIPE